MEITYYGGNCIAIVTKQVAIVIDPVIESYGLKLPKLKADIVLYSTQQANPPLRGEFVIDSPGEYEIKNVSINGIAAQLHIDKPDEPFKSIMYTIEHEAVRLLVTGNIAPGLSDTQQEAVGSINVLVIPVGGHGLTLDASAAAQLTSQIEPQYIVPVHYDDGKTKYPMPQDKLDTFLQELGGETAELDKLKLSSKTLEEETKLIILKRQGS